MPNSLLIVEDNAQIGEVASLVLENFGWRVSWVCDVTGALNHLDSTSVSVVLLDLGLPGINGLHLVKACVDAGIPVLIWTVDMREESIRQALSLGALGYITKDETPEILTTALQTVQSGVPWLGRVALTVARR